jgi:hypothetical protein
MSAQIINDSVTVELLGNFEKEAEWFFEEYNSFKENYRGKYVLVKNKKIVVVANDFETLQAKVKKLGLDITSSFIKYIPEKDIVAII